MALRLSKIAVLSDFKHTERQAILSIALSQLSVQQKIIMRVLKLLLLTPVFISLAYFQGWILLPILLVAGLIYPLLTVPIEIQFAKPHFGSAIENFKNGQVS
ncbi:DUF6170 family protein [Pseudoalteromonas fenneropenaei]|uniref:DUF6170 family protein n=1 Tax=Pseudoalteromonas fenneropenaei TaxID=1737459 RepID=A0ABV7CID3_9GAMM